MNRLLNKRKTRGRKWEREREKQTDRQTDRQTNKDTKRQTLTDKQTETASIIVKDFKEMINNKNKM